jgi:hypothetical protein
VLRAVPAAAEEPCDCPACSDAEFETRELVEAMTADAAELLHVDDPLEAELCGASFVAVGDLAGEGFREALADGIVPAVEALGSPEALAMLLAVDAIVGPPAAGAARRLIDSGVPAPRWAAELREPLRFGRCQRFADELGDSSVLLCSFERAGRSHGFLVTVDHTDCDAASEVVLFPGEVLDHVVVTIETDIPRAGGPVIPEDLDPAEFRWQVERALDARAVHDQEDAEPDLAEDLDDEDGPGHHLVAALLRARMRVLPEPARPPAPHGDEAGLVYLTSRPPAPELPAKRTVAVAGYQIKVGLRGAKPPIWRRLELPADTSLPALHDIIQVAFGWQDSHLHLFETPYGSFGVPDPDMDHRDESPVTLEQVAPAAGARLQYLYDFGDDWTHDIVVEKVLEGRPVTSPRCTGGRRAGPLEDIGGIWGYQELVAILADPSHPEHNDRLAMAGLTSAADLDPARFDAAEITRALARTR